MFAGLLQNNSEGNQLPGLDMGLLSSAVEKILKFDTEKESFNRTYPVVDHLQRFFNQKAVKHVVEVITNRYKDSQQPITIVDLCCGYGLFTIAIRDGVVNNGVKVSKVVGYDVSGDMIHWAQTNNPHPDHVEFHKKNIEKEFTDVEQFDVATCLFGLHWMNDLEQTVSYIHRSLKPKGIFLSLTPIQIKDLFDFRTNFVNYSKWASAFDESAKKLHPFHYNKQDYLNPLSKFFKTLYEQKKETKFNYTRHQYITFLQSWLQQARHLTNEVPHEIKKDAVAKAYIGDFIDSIDKNLTGNVIIHDDGSIVYTQHTFDFDGEKL